MLESTLSLFHVTRIHSALCVARRRNDGVAAGEAIAEIVGHEVPQPIPASVVGEHIRNLAARIKSQTQGKATSAKPVSLAKLVEEHPDLREPVIDGLLREGETMNVIAAPKIGKSWLVYGLLAAVASGDRWLGSFNCRKGRVLLIDNELHPSTLADRVPRVCRALGADPADIDILSLRGQGETLDRLACYFDGIDRGHYKLIVLDAWYRFTPPGMNENSNSDVMSLYNTLDRYAMQTGAAFAVVHHSSKGSQADKSVTDVGAGAGAQSRAADTHAILRPHEEDGHVVLDAVVRSFRPIEPVVLKWDFPLWRRVEGLKPTATIDRKTKLERRNDSRLLEGVTAVWDALEGGPMTPRKLREATGFGHSRMNGLLEKMVAQSKLEYAETKMSGNATREYRRVGD